MFPELYEHVKSRATLSEESCRWLFEFACRCSSIVGACAEIGVYKGGTAYLIAAACPAKQLHLFDTFAGQPQDDTDGAHRQRDFADTSLEDVKGFLACHSNVVFHPGIFPDTLADTTDKAFAFIHFDADTYQATSAFTKLMWPLVVPGGMVLMHDYGDPNCPGVERAMKEANLLPQWRHGSYHQALFVKSGSSHAH